MQVSFDGLRAFRLYAAGKLSAARLFEHPAYKRIREHAAWAGAALGPADIDRAMAGDASSFPGLRDLTAHSGSIAALEEVLREQASRWAGAAGKAVLRLFPGEDLSGVVVYPVLGYDMGIGGNGVVVMNLNVPQYLNDPKEFLYYLTHELCHVVYERYNPIPRVPPDEDTPAWMALMDWALLSEGSATFSALPMRLSCGGMDERDYLVLQDAAAMRHHIGRYTTDRLLLAAGGMESPLGLVFSERRLAYRVGCELLVRVERELGIEEVRKALCIPPSAAWEKYSPLLSV